MRYYTRQIRKYKEGDIIFSENSSCDGMYIIDLGRVRVFKAGTNEDESNEIELCTLGKKAMFGEMAMIDENRRSASVQALEPTICTLITKKIFEDQLSQIPPWMVNMIKILVTRLRETNEKLRNMVDTSGSQQLNDVSILTVDAEGNAKNKEPEGTGQPTQCQSEKIIADLFKKE